jgi:hypothetical protein
VHYAEAIRSIIYNYGHIDIHELNGTDDHRLLNGLTLSLIVHAAFDDLALWFEAIPVSNTTL